MRFRSEAEIFCSLLFALQDPTRVRIVAGSLSLSLFFSCCLVVFCSPLSRFSLSPLSGAGETQTALRFVVPLVSLRPEHAHRPRPVLLRLQLHLGQRPHLLFSFFLTSSCRWWWVRSVLAEVGLSLSLSLSLWSLFLLAVLLALHARLRCKEKEGVAYQTAPPVMTMIVLVFLGREHGAVSRTVRPELPMLPPLPPAAL